MPFMIHGEAAVATSGTHDDSHSVRLRCTVNGYGGVGDIADSVGDTSFSPPVSPSELGAPSGHKGSSTGCCAKDMAVTSDTIMDNSLLIMIYLTFIEAFIK